MICYAKDFASNMGRLRNGRGECRDRLGAYMPGRENAAAETDPVGESRGIEAVVSSPDAASEPRPRTGAAPHAFHQGHAVRYRLCFAKSGVAALTGHLDFVRTLPRVVRRADSVAGSGSTARRAGRARARTC